MDLFSRFLRASFETSIRRRAARPRARANGLSLERLEERWTPAVGITVVDDSHVTITDTDAGKTANKIEIIDDLNDHNTYIRINGGAKTLLNANAGAAGLLQNLTIDMGAGNDKVVFTTIGEGALTTDLDRGVQLGAGHDSLIVNLGDPAGDALDLGGFALEYEIGDVSGKDDYVVRGGLSAGDFGVEIVDSAGADDYEFKFGDLSDVELFVGLDDSGIGSGKNDVEFSHGDVSDTDVNVSFAFSGAMKNSIEIRGDALVSGSSLNFTITTGDGADTLTVRDNSLDNSSETLVVDLGAGNDIFKLKFDGVSSNDVPALVDGGEMSVQAQLGDGNDKFRAEYHGKGFFVDSGGESAADLVLSVFGGDGNDSLTLRNDVGDDFGAVDDFSFVTIQFSGDAGNDSIDVDLGNLGSDLGNFASLELRIDAGDGADKVELKGTLYDFDNMELLLEVLLGDDGDRDRFASSFRSASGAVEAPNVDPTSTIEGGLEDVFQYTGLMFGERLDDFIN